ncbi:MAG: dTDP-4-dehydrorhamnose reductase [Burkholderiaceae bacterium]|nr:dTDP-4-dehydrorhamnose reductase [Burkholderiaceae bacterium]
MESSRKILLFGANGQVGHALLAMLPALGEVVACTRADVDLADRGALDNAMRALVDRVQPAMIVNAAAYTAVDRAESEPEVAETVNAFAPRAMARAAQDAGACLVHISTDYVFDGEKTGAYIETDPTNPLSVYGATKLRGEQAIALDCARHLILRTSWVFGAHGGNFLKTMLKLAQERDSLRVVADQHGAPTAAALIARSIVTMLGAVAAQPATDARWGLYHLTAGGETSWHGYARYAISRARALGWPIRVADDAIAPITTADYPVAARRPANSRLDTDRIRRAFGLELPDWRAGVDEVLSALQCQQTS